MTKRPSARRFWARERAESWCWPRSSTAPRTPFEPSPSRSTTPPAWPRRCPSHERHLPELWRAGEPPLPRVWRLPGRPRLLLLKGPVRGGDWPHKARALAYHVREATRVGCSAAEIDRHRREAERITAELRTPDAAGNVHCLCCGAALGAPESIRAWEADGLGPRCRGKGRRAPALAPQAG